MEFPQYRKRFDNKSFYELINERSFEEVQLIGEKKFIHQLNAEKYFEIILIQDILSNKDGLYEVISEEEYFRL
jgi:hypothetical protein